MSFKDDGSQRPKYEVMQGVHRRSAGTRHTGREPCAGVCEQVGRRKRGCETSYANC